MAAGSSRQSTFPTRFSARTGYDGGMFDRLRLPIIAVTVVVVFAWIAVDGGLRDAGEFLLVTGLIVWAGWHRLHR